MDEMEEKVISWTGFAVETLIVEAEASRWGVHEGTTHVWFEVERPGPRLGPDQNPLS